MLYLLEVAAEAGKVIPGIEGVKEKLTEKEMLLNTYIKQAVSGLVEYAPKALSAIIVLIIGMWLIKRIAIISEKSMVKRDLEISLRTFLKSLISIGLKIILIVTVAGMLGIGTASFVTILGAAGLAVGLALQGSLSNFAGGVLILIFKPFKVGDGIEAQGQSGEVKEIQIFNTILLTGDHKTIILPNGPLSNGAIVNTTRYGNLRIDLPLNVSHDNDIKKVKQIIYSVLELNDKIIKHPPPAIFIGRVIEGSVHINVKLFCLPDDTARLTSELNHDIYLAFEKNNIKLPVAKIIST
jgi:small conductance mechanosensitive channel